MVPKSAKRRGSASSSVGVVSNRSEAASASDVSRPSCSSTWAESSFMGRKVPKSQFSLRLYELRRVHNPARLWHKHGSENSTPPKRVSRLRWEDPRTGRLEL